MWVRCALSKRYTTTKLSRYFVIRVDPHCVEGLDKRYLTVRHYSKDFSSEKTCGHYLERAVLKNSWLAGANFGKWTDCVTIDNVTFYWNIKKQKQKQGRDVQRGTAFTLWLTNLTSPCARSDGLTNGQNETLLAARKFSVLVFMEKYVNLFLDTEKNVIFFRFSFSVFFQ